MTSTQVRIKSKSQFGPFAIVDSTGNDNIQLGYGLGVGVYHTPYGRAYFKEGMMTAGGIILLPFQTKDCNNYNDQQ